jgi:hypothetical protein
MDIQGHWKRIHKEKGLMRNLETSLALIKKLAPERTFADRKTDSQSVGSSHNGSHLGPAKLHVTHSKDENRP